MPIRSGNFYSIGQFWQPFLALKRPLSEHSAVDEPKRLKSEAADCPGCVDDCTFLCRFRDSPKTEIIHQPDSKSPNIFFPINGEMACDRPFPSPVLADEVFKTSCDERRSLQSVQVAIGRASTVTLLSCIDQLVDNIRRPRSSGSVTVLRELSPKFHAPVLPRHEYNALVTPTGWITFSYLLIDFSSRLLSTISSFFPEFDLNVLQHSRKKDDIYIDHRLFQ